ncbi:hypothetical protein [Aquamicrobium ahrensii]|uniref:Uncharacterized protein n=1 Tax=Aquamicrobium ahrensii TaxID=469551 RepID=A0ABV2KN40_9HYPH
MLSLLEIWATADQDPALFWRLTLREISIILKGAAARLTREQDGRAWVAWHIEALARTKKLPTLKSMQSGKPLKRRRMTPNEMISMAHLWTAATTMGRC